MTEDETMKLVSKAVAETYSERMRRELGADIVKKPATRQELYVVVDQLIEKLKGLEGRLFAMEARGVKYVGTWQKAGDYSRGDVVTDQGSMWVCLRDGATGARPATSPDAWQLSAKGK